ncbi:pilus assembly FimT family protein [Crocosphaera chwakensis]|uniref:Prepilin-type N-terminal cleavage/methylation domain-containing protein n=1 Tax=Crocosphaera chwakensis CCY0110 TaxID=391612 RepID=A3IKW6_9CHRO|nr:hypothetical protein [Crocosphaera chwakensis]EAZ92835.1 hypothetical protein CY0110_22102 [Crocosphaera chwakensis CCY0110]
MLKIYLKLLQKYRPSAGWTLAELMIATAMTLVVVMVAGFGLITILRENKVANATGEMQYDLNRATEFISEEIRSAKTIENNIIDVEDYAPTFFEKHPGATPILALKIDGVYERVIYYVDEVASNEVWRGPGVIRRFGPAFNDDGEHSEAQKRDPDLWQSTALVDMMVVDLDSTQTQCKNLPFDPSESDGVNTYIATDDEGKKWYRFPQATADVKGFFSCIREDKQLAQLNVLGTSLDEFQHLGYDKDDIVQKKSRYSEKMEYAVATMTHARSESIGSGGENVPSFKANSSIVFEEDGQASIQVLYADIPCSDDITTSNDITISFVTDSGSEGTVSGIGTGSAVSFTQGQEANAHIKENTFCTRDTTLYDISVNDSDSVKFVTNDNSDHTKLSDIIPSPSSTIITKLSQQGLIREATDGSYDFTLPDNIVLYFVEFELVKNETILDPILNEYIQAEQTDSPHFDDAIYLVEMTK